MTDQQLIEIAQRYGCRRGLPIVHVPWTTCAGSFVATVNMLDRRRDPIITRAEGNKPPRP